MLEGVERVLVIDWPSPEVPELLARSGLQVVVRGGPDRVDLVYTFRPLDDRLDSIRFGRGWRERTPGLLASGQRSAASARAGGDSGFEICE